MTPTRRVPWHIPLAVVAVILVVAAIIAASGGLKKSGTDTSEVAITTTAPAAPACTDDQEARILASVKSSLEATEQDPTLAISVMCDATSVRLESQLFRKTENKPAGMGLCVVLQSAAAEVGVTSNPHLVVGTPDGGVIGSTNAAGFCQGRT